MMKQINKQAVAAAFDRAAKSYTAYDDLQRRSAKELLSLLDKRDFTTVLDAGCGPGSNSLFWRKTGSLVIAIDLSVAMLIQARKRQAADAYLVADIEALPLADGKFDLVWSHLAVQWCTSLTRAISSLYRVTRPGGKVAFTTLLADSLSELNQAWHLIDKQPHTNRFLTRKKVESILSTSSYRSCIQVITLYFNDAKSAMRSLKGVGATHLHCGRSKKILTRKQLLRLEEGWPRRETKRYPMTYQLFHGIIERG